MIKRSLATYLKNRAANEALQRIARADDDAKGTFFIAQRRPQGKFSPQVGAA